MKETFVAESLWQTRDGSGSTTQTVLALVLGTEASTYQKPGAMALLRGSEIVAGMVSGGCLESDLAERVVEFLNAEGAQGKWCYVRYDTRQAADDILGAALGCRGALDLALLRTDTDGVADFFATSWSSQSGLMGWCSVDAQAELRAWTVPHDGALSEGALERDAFRCPRHCGNTETRQSDAEHSSERHESERHESDRHEIEQGMEGLPLRLLSQKLKDKPLRIPKRRSLLVCGCGRDALPLLRMFLDLGFELTVVDHRPDDVDRTAEALRRGFEFDAGVPLPPSALKVWSAAELMAGRSAVTSFDAALVMSHHLEWDGRYLTALGKVDPRKCYVGLLGPSQRRREVFAAAPAAHVLDAPELHSPMGLRFKTRGPHAVAVGVVAEVLQHLDQSERHAHDDGGS